MDITIFNQGLSFETNADLERALQIPEVRQRVDETEETFRLVNVADAVNQLSLVSSCLALAYSGSMACHCQIEITQITFKYHDLIAASQRAGNSFVRTCIRSLDYHVCAIELARAEEKEAAIAEIRECEKLARFMATEADGVVHTCDELVGMTETATVDSQSEQQAQVEMQRQVQEQINQCRELKAGYEAAVELLEKQFQEIKETEKQLLQDLRETRFEERVMTGIQMVLGTVSRLSPFRSSDSDGKAASEKHSITKELQKFWADARKDTEVKQKECDEIEVAVVKLETELATEESKDPKNEVRISQLRQEIAVQSRMFEQKKRDLEQSQSQFADIKRTIEARLKTLEAQYERLTETKESVWQKRYEQNVALQQSIERLSCLSNETDHLKKTVVCLNATVTTLVGVRAIFASARDFWIGMADQCHDAANRTESLEGRARIPRLFQREIASSAIRWLALGRLSLTAQSAFRQIRLQADREMLQLPTSDEAASMIESRGPEILRRLRELVPTQTRAIEAPEEARSATSGGDDA